MTLVLGVDGGNTKTVALVARGDGTVIGSGRAGCADVYGAESPEAAIEAIVSAVADALTVSGVPGSALDAAVFCLAGADWPEDYALHHRELTSRIGLARTATVYNDAIATLRAGTPDAVGVAAVVGTGGAIAGRNERGETWHLGFWPDSCGARPLGREALPKTQPPDGITGRLGMRHLPEKGDYLVVISDFTKSRAAHSASADAKSRDENRASRPVVSR